MHGVKIYKPADLNCETHYILSTANELAELTSLEAKIIFYNEDLSILADNHICSRDEIFDINRISTIAKVWLSRQDMQTQRFWYLSSVLGLHQDYRSLFELMLCSLTDQNKKDPDDVLIGVKTLDYIKRLKSEIYIAQELFKDHSLNEVKKMVSEHLQQHQIDSSKRLNASEMTTDTKKMLKRAWKMTDRFGYSNDVRMLINQNTITISHDASLFQFKFSIIKGSEKGHGALKVGVETKHDEPLAKLCVYIDGTPSIDQFVAFSNLIEKGHEGDILSAANFLSVTDLGYKLLNGYKLPYRDVDFKRINVIENNLDKGVYRRASKREKQTVNKWMDDVLGLKRDFKNEVMSLSPKYHYDPRSKYQDHIGISLNHRLRLTNG